MKKIVLMFAVFAATLTWVFWPLHDHGSSEKIRHDQVPVVKESSWQQMTTVLPSVKADGEEDEFIRRLPVEIQGEREIAFIKKFMADEFQITTNDLYQVETVDAFGLPSRPADDMIIALQKELLKNLGTNNYKLFMDCHMVKPELMSKFLASEVPLEDALQASDYLATVSDFNDGWEGLRTRLSTNYLTQKLRVELEQTMEIFRPQSLAAGQ